MPSPNDSVDRAKLIDTLEQLIDKHTIFVVLQTIAEVAYLKAEHIHQNYNDDDLYAAWSSIGEDLMKTAIGKDGM